MKESTQTLLFIAAALFSILVATQSQPTDETFAVEDLIGQSLFPEFTAEEADQAKAMRIVRIDEETATMRDFEVAETDGVWSLPSRGGYPADAERQMAEATSGLVGLEVLGIASRSAADHADYGVIEPSKNVEVGQSGVGTHVTLTDIDGESLVDVVIGKPVKDADNLRFVRRTSQDVVFVVEIDPSKFSTKFEDWIESDLLDLEPWDLARVRTKDYSSQLIPQMTSRGPRQVIAIDPRADLTVAYDESESEWQPVELLAFNREKEDGDYEPFELAKNEELNKEALDALKEAVGDLEIVDVERKPSGLSGDLKAGDDFFEDAAAMNSLKRRGFAPTTSKDGTEILSTEGEVILSTKEGVEYVLRFGDLEYDSSLGEQPTDEDASEEGAEKSTGVNRFLFVMAQVNKDLIEKPELEELPEEEPIDEGEGSTEEEATESEDNEAPEDTREEVEKRNQRKLDEYQQKLDETQKRVDELNERFGDWYYIIADEVYKKISLGRDDLIKAKESEEEGGEPAAGRGPLGSTGSGIPGLPNVPGVEFNPAASTEAESTEAEDAEPAESSGSEPATEEPLEENAEAAAETPTAE